MLLYQNKLYFEDIDYVCKFNFPWEKLQDKSILVSGSTGLLGSFFTDVLLEKNNQSNLNCKIYALTRNKKRAEERFCKFNNSSDLVFIETDVNSLSSLPSLNKIDYVVHLASNTHPLQYSTDPIGTISSNIIGLKNMLDFAAEHKAEKFIFASSNEIYGENRGDVNLFDEKYCGYIDCNTLRAGYPESKRCGEALCQAYKEQKNLNIGIARFTRSYGPTMLMSDSKAISQFIKNAVAGEDIVLKSAGNQLYSYQYVSDSVSGLLTILFSGENGEAYNIADSDSNISLKDLASLIADFCKTKVVFNAPSAIEAAGYSKATKALLDGKKLKDLGWKPKYNISLGIKRTIEIFKTLN